MVLAAKLGVHRFFSPLLSLLLVAACGYSDETTLSVEQSSLQHSDLPYLRCDSYPASTVFDPTYAKGHALAITNPNFERRVLQAAETFEQLIWNHPGPLDAADIEDALINVHCNYVDSYQIRFHPFADTRRGEDSASSMRAALWVLERAQALSEETTHRPWATLPWSPTTAEVLPRLMGFAEHDYVTAKQFSFLQQQMWPRVWVRAIDTDDWWWNDPDSVGQILVELLPYDGLQTPAYDALARRFNLLRSLQSKRRALLQAQQRQATVEISQSLSTFDLAIEHSLASLTYLLAHLQPRGYAGPNWGWIYPMIAMTRYHLLREDQQPFRYSNALDLLMLYGAFDQQGAQWIYRAWDQGHIDDLILKDQARALRRHEPFE